MIGSPEQNTLLLQAIPLAFSRNPSGLLVVGAIATVYGLHLIKCGIQGDTLMPGTSFTYLPRWLFIATGLVIQIPLPAAIWYIQWAKTAI